MEAVNRPRRQFKEKQYRTYNDAGPATNKLLEQCTDGPLEMDPLSISQSITSK